MTAFSLDGDGNAAANLMRVTQHGRLWGREGNDTLIGGTGISDFYGNEGDDELHAGDGGGNYSPGSGNDTVFGGAGNDRIRVMDQVAGGNYGTDSVSGGNGSDWLEFDDDALTGITADLSAGFVTGGGVSGSGTVQVNGVENVHGSNFADRITGDANANWLYGDAGVDTLNGGAGNDTLTGGETAAADIFAFSHFGAANADIVDQLISGSDKIALDASAFTAIGASGDFAAGDARFISGAGVNSGQDATDRVAYNTSTGELWYDADGSGSGAAQLIATFSPGSALAATDIQVFGSPPPPTGGQTINGTAGNDTLAGGTGNDTINGVAGNDLLQGLGGNDSIVGATGWDTLQGGEGDDRLYAGGWSDTMTGGAGADSFVWAETGANNRDTVTDFASGTDEVLLENGALTALGAAGAWAAGDARFWAAAGATSGHDGDDRLIYNTTTGNLYYDADGSGAGAAQVVATFTGAPGIVATDITVI
jgi:serralysin